MASLFASRFALSALLPRSGGEGRTASHWRCGPGWRCFLQVVECLAAAGTCPPPLTPPPTRKRVGEGNESAARLPTHVSENLMPGRRIYYFFLICQQHRI